MSNTIYYFAYGMLTDPAVIGDVKFVNRAVLLNWQFELLRFANLVPNSGNRVYGALWEIDQQTLDQLDNIEGYPDLYLRKTLPVVDSKNNKYLAEVYIMTKNTRNRLINTEPSAPYLKSLEQGYRFAGIPLNQLYNK
jgi:gamma-glutamylcyclotransferase (GGCT)/AIG2-like uncharacterized protein YtfP